MAGVRGSSGRFGNAPGIPSRAEEAAVKPPSFHYASPTTVTDAVNLLVEHAGEEPRVLAGGQSLIPLMNFRLAQPGYLVDLRRVAGLDAISHDGDVLVIGAMVRQAAAERSPEVALAAPLMAEALHYVAHLPIRNSGTVVGSIAHADPAAEWCMLALALDATIEARSVRGDRAIPVASFFRSYYATALEPDELIVAIDLPRPTPRTALVEFSRRRGDFALAAACVTLDVVEGRCRRARVVLGGIGATVVRSTAAEAALIASQCTAAAFMEAAREAAAETDPPSDIHATGAYRKRLVATLVYRALLEVAPKEVLDVAAA
jgi:carbon-monoxide dehydrogenase medium subunit